MKALKRVGKLAISVVLIVLGGVPIGTHRRLSDLAHQEKSRDSTGKSRQ